MTVARVAQLALLVGAAVAVAGCGRNCVPPRLAQSKTLIDLSQPPDAHAPVPRGVERGLAEELRNRDGNPHPPGARPYTFLAMSGGGFYAPFAAGVLAAWTETGTRPQFDVVTGISTGALMATFAFLGPEYDGMLVEKFVGIERRSVIGRRALAALPFAPSFYHSRRFARAIEDLNTPEMMTAVARAHAEGRRLYVGTTNLDTRSLVIWDMGAIASRGTREAADLYRDVILASSSVPGVLPPVRIKVEIDGKCYEEMHADGGVSDTVMFRPFMVGDLNRARGVPGHRAPPGSAAYLVNNGKLYTEAKCVRPLIWPQLSASYKSLLYGKSRDEMHRIYLICLEAGIDYRLTAIPQDMVISTDVMNVPLEDQYRLFEAGRAIGAGAAVVGPGWRDHPPGYGPAEQVLPRAGTRFVTRPGPGGPCEPAPDLPGMPFEGLSESR
jgi:predicted acylesterase/phospholipase RssA